MSRVPSKFDRRVRAGLIGTLALLAAVTAADTVAAASIAAEGDSISVMVDNAKVIRLPEQTATVVVGNPSIADVTSRPRGVVILTGKGLGVTNLIALDSSGTLITEAVITVQAPTATIVSIQRGADIRNSYTCAPRCQPTAVLGDNKDWFNDVSAQADRRNQLAAGASIPLTAPGAPNGPSGMK